MRSAPARTATLALAALLTPLAVVPLAACSSPHHRISTSGPVSTAARSARP